jgi:hypothetical protein
MITKLETATRKAARDPWWRIFDLQNNVADKLLRREMRPKQRILPDAHKGFPMPLSYHPKRVNKPTPAFPNSED